MSLSAMRRTLAVLGCLFALVVLAVPAAFEAIDWRHPPPLAQVHDLSFEVVDHDGRLLRAFANGDGRWRLLADLEEIDPRFAAMLIAYEDKRFWRHRGVDPLALMRALWQLVTHGRVVSGGSTITMQLARLVEPGRDRDLGFKLRQMVRALQIERRMSKREILTAYLTLAPYGGNIEGLRAASLAYFGREPRHLPPGDAALLVALPQSPEARRPDRHPDAARAARDRVLSRLVSVGALEPMVAEAAARRPAPSGRLALPVHAPHLARALRKDDPARRRVATTIDRDLQRSLEEAAADHAQSVGSQTTAAVLVVEHGMGRVVAHIGSAGLFEDRRAGAIDMTQATRSPGSTLKPFIYGIGFETGLIHPETLIDDRPARFGGYAPENFDDTYQGTVTVREALAASLNVPAVMVLDAVGPHRLVARMARAGVRPELPPGGAPGLAIGLGGVGLSLTDLVTLYAGLARGGEPVALTTSGDVELPGPDRVLSEVAAHQITQILRTTPPPHASAGGAIAFKTGTSYGHRDAWAIGYDGRHVIGVWIGRADGAPVAKQTGITSAAPLLFDAFARLPSDRSPFAPAPSRTSAVSTADLPHALRHFRPAGSTSSGDFSAPLALAFPPDGARIDRSAGTVTRPLVLRAQGGRMPLAWFADGRPLAASPRRRQAEWRPDGPGFSTLTVVDAGGRSVRSRVFVAAN